jgi:hypothetical protein
MVTDLLFLISCFVVSELFLEVLYEKLPDTDDMAPALTDTLSLFSSLKLSLADTLVPVELPVVYSTLLALLPPSIPGGE